MTTLLEAVKASLHNAGKFNPGDMVAPAAILWADADEQWRPVVEQLRPLMPELFTLGDFQPEKRIGPAIWLRCIIERTLSEFEYPDDAIPIIYLPKISRQTLRAGEECPESLKPLVELQFRGTVWTQRNGRDWTVEAFLVSDDGGLGLDLAKDRLTKEAMLLSLEQLAVTPISRLLGKKLEAQDFYDIVSGDVPRNLLLWLSDPRTTRKNWDDNTWKTFSSQCKKDYGFDPESEGELVAGEKLGKVQDDVWKGVWRRFNEAPSLYPHIADLLKRAKPSGEIIFDKETWPDENENEEASLRKDLLALEKVNPFEARSKIETLEKRHGLRRDWVWARLGLSQLAISLQHLNTLAKYTAQSIGSESPDAMAKMYAEQGFQADLAVLQSLTAVKSNEDTKAVKTAIQVIYKPWLEDAAQHFQKLTQSQPLPTYEQREQESVQAESGECLLFVDALRYDISQMLLHQAETQKLLVQFKYHFAGLPTVTATSKPGVSPIANQLFGKVLGDDFLPMIKDGEQSLTTDRFRKLLAQSGYQVFDATECGNPTESNARGWTEFGEFDKLGHHLESKLANQIDEQLNLIIERIQELLKAGWKKVRVVTDHGWLLLPGGLPSVPLPKYLTKSRWTRCAAINDSSHVDCPTAPWYWNPHEYFAYGPGIHCYEKGHEYAHGGVSLQECVIPELTFQLDGLSHPVSVNIKSIQWIGMRCRIHIDPVAIKLMADLRTKPNDASSSITERKAFDAEGRLSLLVADDSLEGTVVSLVVLAPSGQIIGKATTTVGEE